MKPIKITTATHEVLFQLSTIRHVEKSGVVHWPKVGEVEPNEITGIGYAMVPAKITTKNPTQFHRSAVRALEALHIQSGIKLHTC